MKNNVQEDNDKLSWLKKAKKMPEGKVSGRRIDQA